MTALQPWRSVGNPTDAFRSVGFIHCILLRFKLSPWASYFLSWALFLTLSVVVLYTTTLYIDNSRQQDLTPMTTSWRHSHEFIMPRDHNYDFPFILKFIIMLTIAKVIQSKHTIKPLSTLTSILPSPRTMTIYSLYLCAALGRESSLVPIHGTDDSVQQLYYHGYCRLFWRCVLFFS